MSKGLVPYYTLYRKFYDEEEKRDIILFSEFIGDGPTVVLKENIILNIDEFPFAVWKSKLNADEFLSKSPLMDVLPLAELDVLLTSLIANAAIDAVNPSLVASSNTGLTSDQVAEIAMMGAGGAFTIASNGQIAQEIMYLQKPSVQQNYSYLVQERQRIAAAMGINPIDLGETGSVRNAGAMNLLNINAEKQDHSLLEGFALFKTKLTRLAVKLMLANFDARKIVYQPNNPNSEDAFVMAYYDPDVFEGLDVDFMLDGKVYSQSQ